MKAGNFNIKNYLEKLHENAETNGNLPAEHQDGIIIPDENKKAFSWLKKEYDKAKTEVKVEIKMGGSKFEPGYELQTDLKSVKDFKPGMYGEIKTSDTPGSKKKEEDTAKTQAEVEGNKPENEKKAEKSTGNEAPEKKISAKVKTTDEVEDKPKKKQKKIKKEEKKEEDDQT